MNIQRAFFLSLSLLFVHASECALLRLAGNVARAATRLGSRSMTTVVPEVVLPGYIQSKWAAYYDVFKNEKAPLADLKKWHEEFAELYQKAEATRGATSGSSDKACDWAYAVGYVAMCRFEQAQFEAILRSVPTEQRPALVDERLDHVTRQLGRLPSVDMSCCAWSDAPEKQLLYLESLLRKEEALLRTLRDAFSLRTFCA